MPQKISEMPIIISNGRVSERVTLPKEVKEKLSVKNGDYLQYLLIKMDMS
jgi:hypothetical protein